MAALLLAACAAKAPTADRPTDDGSGSGAAVAPPVRLPPATLQERPAGRWIDAHAHLGGPDVAPVVGSVLDENAVDYIFNLSGGSPRRGQGAAMALSAANGGRVINFMNIDWDGIDEPGFAESIAADLELVVTRYGYGGLKVAKSLGLYVRDASGRLVAVDDPRLTPIWEKAGALGVPIFIHVADPAAFWKPATPDNERYAELQAHPSWSFADATRFPPREQLLAGFERIVAANPGTTFVGVHVCHNAEDLTYVDRMLSTYPNLWLDISARIPELGRHPADQVRALFEKFQDRILFATDIAIFKNRSGQLSFTLGSSGDVPDTREGVRPFYEAHHRYLETGDRGIAHPTPIQGNWTVDAIALPPAVIDKLYYLNAYRLVVGPTLRRRALAEAASAQR
jgi:predicted TIM-barrel fold metal-dependent hydrolase